MEKLRFLIVRENNCKKLKITFEQLCQRIFYSEIKVKEKRREVMVIPL